MTDTRAKLLERIDACRNLIWQLQNGLLQLSVERGNRGLAEQAASDLGLLAGLIAGPDGQEGSLPHALQAAAADLAAGRVDEASATALFEAVETLDRAARGEREPLERLLQRLADEARPATPRAPALEDDSAGADPEDLKLFCAEAREHLGSVEASLLDLERSGSGETVAEVFRAVHSIKGGAQYVGLEATATLAHRTEALLDRLRKGEREPSSEVVAVLLAATDGLSTLIRAAEAGERPDLDAAHLVARVDELLAQLPTGQGPGRGAAPASAPDAAAAFETPAAQAGPRGDDEPFGEPSVDQGDAATPVSDLDLFASEYRANATELHRLLATLDSLPRDREEARLLARALHSLKGIAGFVGASDIERLAAALDRLLDRVLRHRTEVPPDVKRIAVRTEEAIESLFESLCDGKPRGTDVLGLLGQLAALSEREERTMSWGKEPAAAQTDSWDADPLRGRLAAVEAAVEAGDADRLGMALEDLAEIAELQGFDELSEAARAARGEAAGFASGGGRDLVDRLASLFPAADDLLGAPEGTEGPAPAPDQAARAAVPASLEAQISEDDFDQDLVRIFLDTNAARLANVEELLGRGEAPRAAGLLGDMSAAAAYMGYEPLAELLSEMRVALEKPFADVGAISKRIGEAARALEAIRRRLGAVAPGQPQRTSIEEEELDQIFRESARSHLGDLFANVMALEHGADAERLDAVNHHLGCLHSAATNTGRGDAAASIERTQAALERALEPGVAVSRESVAALGALVEGLYRACGLVPPAPRVSSLPAPMPEPAGAEVPSAPAAVAVAAAPQPAAPAAGPVAEDGEVARGLVEAQTTVRVDTRKIDDLMNMVAELVVNRSSFLVLSSNVREVLVRLLDSGRIGQVEARDLRHVLDRYDETTTDLGRVSNQLQEGVMRIRMMPVRTLFSRVPRLVRDLALRESKQVKVVFSGEETELDKTVIEQLSDPLVHLLRNAISHGIESPGQRLSSGKGAEGTLRITARHQGNMVILDVEDDGRGIDLEAVRRVLVDRGLSSQVEAARLGSRDLMSALFLPGFSTARAVSDVSGRGVGLDVVKRNIESLGGQIEVFTEPGRATRFSIRIPLTMAIMQALLVRVAEEVYSIPVSAVIQTVKVGRGDISTVEGQEVLTLRGRVVPLVRLSDVFEYRYHEETGQERSRRPDEEALYAVVLQGEGREIAVAAEGMIGSQDLVIKSLEDDLVDARGVAGAAILGDGTVTLILDVPEIQKMAVDRERYRERRLSDTMRAFDRLVRDRAPAESGVVH